MRAILVNQNPRLVVAVERVPADMSALLHQQYARIQPRSEPLGQNTACEPGSHNEVIKHTTPHASPLRRSYLERSSVACTHGSHATFPRKFCPTTLSR